MNTQEALFEENYPEVFDALVEFMRLILSGEDTLKAKMAVVNSLVDVYSLAFYSEVSYMIDLVGVDYSSTDINNIQNSVDTSAYKRSNQSRIMTVLTTNEDELRAKIIDEELSEQAIVELFLPNLVRIALAETHMCIEKASVNSGKLAQNVFDVKLNKTWNCVGDHNTCATCLAMNGITVPVDESFTKYAPSGIPNELSYTGGDISYAHPRCRCWLTYSKA